MDTKRKIAKKILHLTENEFASNAFLGEHSVMSINELTFFYERTFIIFFIVVITYIPNFYYRIN